MPNVALNTDLMLPDEAAAYTRLSVKTLAKMRCRGTSMPFLKLGKKVMYRRSDLDRWLAGCLVQARASTAQAASVAA
jgi:excisionase family DNA binding protein